MDDYIGPDRNNIRPGELTPGRVVYRWTDLVKDAKAVRVPLPCHEQQTIIADTAAEAVAVCRLCSNTYDLQIIDDHDGGYTARLIVAYRPFLLSRAYRS